MTDKLKELFERAESWPKVAQDELVELAQEIEGELTGLYHPMPEERAAIDQGLKEASAGNFATEEEVANVLKKFRNA